MSSYFLLSTGKKIFTSASPLVEVRVPNTSVAYSRYVAYGFKPRDWEVGILQYGSESNIIQSIRVQTPQKYVGVPTVSLVYEGKEQKSELELWGADGLSNVKSLSNFQVRVRYFDGSEITIPVENDRLLPEKAKVPEGFKLSVASSF
jgi:hypothetical protein